MYKHKTSRRLIIRIYTFVHPLFSTHIKVSRTNYYKFWLFAVIIGYGSGQIGDKADTEEYEQANYVLKT